MSNRTLFVSAASLLILVSTVSCAGRDEAKRAHVPVSRLLRPPPIPDYFGDMDYTVLADGSAPKPLSPEGIAGRNMWIVWTGGNDRLWDRLTIDSIGTFDLLKVISSHRTGSDYTTGYG